MRERLLELDELLEARLLRQDEYAELRAETINAFLRPSVDSCLTSGELQLSLVAA